MLRIKTSSVAKILIKISLIKKMLIASLSFAARRLIPPWGSFSAPAGVTQAASSHSRVSVKKREIKIFVFVKCRTSARGIK